MRDSWVGLLFGIGLILSVRPESASFIYNPWRFGYSIPITIVVLALIQRFGNRWLELLVVLVLSGVSALNDARSSFALLLVTAILVAWQIRPFRRGRPGSTIAVLVGIPVVAVIVYNLGQALILGGFLGESTRARSEAQVEASGSLILGGRPEISATLALMRDHWWGYGSGVIPSLADVMSAKTGLAAINYMPNNGYVESYMFGSGFELHSLFGDFWAHFGVVGLLLCGTIAVLVGRTVGQRMAIGSANAIVLYAAVKTLWNIPFSPLLSSIPLLVLAIGLGLMKRPADPQVDLSFAEPRTRW
jgi:hypothetical protein